MGGERLRIIVWSMDSGLKGFSLIWKQKQITRTWLVLLLIDPTEKFPILWRGGGWGNHVIHWSWSWSSQFLVRKQGVSGCRGSTPSGWALFWSQGVLHCFHKDTSGDGTHSIKGEGTKLCEIYCPRSLLLKFLSGSTSGPLLFQDSLAQPSYWHQSTLFQEFSIHDCSLLSSLQSVLIWNHRLSLKMVVHLALQDKRSYKVTFFLQS
jgi:hypothetical protein